MCSKKGVSAANESDGIRKRVEDHPIPAATSAPRGGCQKTSLAARNPCAPNSLQLLRNDPVPFFSGKKSLTENLTSLIATQ